MSFKTQKEKLWWKRTHTEVKMKKTPSVPHYNLTMIIWEMKVNSMERLNIESRSKVNDNNGWHFKENIKVLMTAESFSLQTHTHTFLCREQLIHYQWSSAPSHHNSPGHTEEDDPMTLLRDTVAKITGWMMKMRLLTQFYLDATYKKRKLA